MSYKFICRCVERVRIQWQDNDSCFRYLRQIETIFERETLLGMVTIFSIKKIPLDFQNCAILVVHLSCKMISFLIAVGYLFDMVFKLDMVEIRYGELRKF